MEVRNHDDRAFGLLESIKPELLKLLEGSPPYGAVGIDINFHNGEVIRIVSRTEVSRKPQAGGASSGRAGCERRGGGDWV